MTAAVRRNPPQPCQNTGCGHHSERFPDNTHCKYYSHLWLTSCPNYVGLER